MSFSDIISRNFVEKSGVFSENCLKYGRINLLISMEAVTAPLFFSKSVKCSNKTFFVFSKV